ncbi:hypothetical protein ABI59_06285 [Acidobacteria bacterium Mor1]|nr:hypothetical protein ABI59_06285 [Acidobacteria bacterium Mor1]
MTRLAADPMFAPMTILKAATRLGVAGLAAAVLLAATAPDASARRKKKEAPAPEVRTLCTLPAGELLYVGRSDGLVVMDPADPLAPRELSRMRLRAPVQDLALEGQRLYLAIGSRGVLVIDVSDPAAPEVLGEYDTPGSAAALAVREGIVWVADGTAGIAVIDLNNPERPVLETTRPTRNRVRGIALEGDLLVTAEGTAGVRVFDVSGDADRPRPLPAPRGLDGALDVLLRNGKLYVPRGRAEIAVLVYDGDTFVPDGRLSTAGNHVRHLELEADTLYASIPRGVLSYDLLAEGSSPVETRLRGSLSAGALAGAGEHLFLSAGNGGLAVLELTAEGPRRLGSSGRRMTIRFER